VIYECGFAMVDVSNDGDIANLVFRMHWMAARLSHSCPSAPPIRPRVFL
jgi:hypothetical protein